MGVVRGGKQEATRAGSGNLGKVERLLGGAGSCPGCAQVGTKELAGHRQHFTAEVSAEVLWEVEHSVLWVIAEIPETASRKHPEAKHRGSAGV